MIKTINLEKPFRLSRNAWAAYFLIGVPVLVFAKLWNSELSIEIGLAFLAAIISAAFFLTVVWLAYDFGGVTTPFGFTAVIIANLVLVDFQARRPIQPPLRNAGSRPLSSARIRNSVLARPAWLT